MKCPNCGVEDIEVMAQISIVAKLDELLEGRLFNIKDWGDDIDYMWCRSCSQGVKLLEDGTLITYLRYMNENAKMSKPIDKNALIKALKGMSPEDRAKLVGKEV